MLRGSPTTSPPHAPTESGTAGAPVSRRGIRPPIQAHAHKRTCVRLYNPHLKRDCPELRSHLQQKAAERDAAANNNNNKSNKGVSTTGKDGLPRIPVTLSAGPNEEKLQLEALVDTGTSCVIAGKTLADKLAQNGALQEAYRGARRGGPEGSRGGSPRGAAGAWRSR